MRTVHEPEQVKGAPATTADSPAPTGRKGKAKLANGTSRAPAPAPSDPASLGPLYDEDGNPVEPSPPNDNITYTPAFHPITRQPGFMIRYPPDIHFTSWESSINADTLRRALRRQLHWAHAEGNEIKRDLRDLEQRRREEWTLKEILLEGVMEAELARGQSDDELRESMSAYVHDRMEQDVIPSKRLKWTGGDPDWRHGHRADVIMRDREDDPNMTPSRDQRTPSPPPSGRSGGFDGDQDPYDNYLTGMMAQYEAREKQRSVQNTPQQQDGASREEDAAGALMGLSNGPGAKLHSD